MCNSLTARGEHIRLVRAPLQLLDGSHVAAEGGVVHRPLTAVHGLPEENITSAVAGQQTTNAIKSHVKQTIA